MVVFVTCKNEEDPIKDKGARGVTALFIDFSDFSKATNSVVGDGILLKLLWLSLLPSRMKKIHLKMKALEWSQHFSYCKYMWIFTEA